MLKYVIYDDIWKYERQLRFCEYVDNCSKSKVWLKKLAPFANFRLYRMSRKTGFQIPLNVFDKGLSIAHIGTIIVNKSAKVGKNCRIHDGVCIGAENRNPIAANIGDNCFIATGVKIIGEVEIGDNIAIGANAVVTKSFPEGNITIAGVPARKISEENSFSNLNQKLMECELLH
ncbi:serine O-acetyltransferase [Holdemania massiliensis]|uniref:serine O-acetyltransferase n=1 Tax=Holdemania massiliensis TaxID=1468449 RepID=UPI001F058F41|nr:hypothetical protein [Holdemania massiliensis]MCH1940710.1 hypothetical protein [Holdemania massiliensis]